MTLRRSQRERKPITIWEENQAPSPALDPKITVENTHRDMDITSGRTALVLAAKYGQEAVAKLLINEKADITSTDYYGWTALHFAARFGYRALIKLLIDKQADIEARGKNGRTALALAADHGHESMLLLLIENGADVEARDGDGWTAMHYAARYGHEAVAQLLLDKNTNFIERRRGGQTAPTLPVDYWQKADKRSKMETKDTASLIYPPLRTPPIIAGKRTYFPLTGSRAIRVLDVQPGKFSDPIQCTFGTIPLDDWDVEYEAVSYVWGTGEPSHEIWFPEDRFLVRSNLYFALLRFRNNATARRLWVDAICTISWERMQLGMSYVERIECMKSWHRSKILKEKS